MSQLIEHGPATEEPRPPSPDTGSARRLVLAIVVLGLLLGAVAGWSAFAVLSPPSAEERSVEAQRARWEGLAEEAAERAEAEARRLDVERQRWEAQADRFTPGWRDR
jgi:hypothetical protein